MDKLTLSISIPGIIVFFLAMIPNFAYMLTAPMEQLDNDKKKSRLNAEDLSRDFFAFFLVAFKSESFSSPIYLVGAIVFLLLYYVSWARYFRNGKKTELLLAPLWKIPVPLAVFPVLYFILSSLYLNNVLSMALAVIFGFFHIKESYRKSKKSDDEE